MAVIDKSDPYAVLYVKAEGEKKWQRLGQTEVAWNNLNPIFIKTFMVNYLFEKNQTVKVEIYDYDDDEYYDDGYSLQQCYDTCESNRQTCYAFCGSLPNDTLFMSPRDNCESDCQTASMYCRRAC